eukprot:m.175857 g.175857  ORF g.175857 m.175857 type:complete len:1282 (+) comp31832_c1_seq5:147-3992(+)
MCYIHTHRMFPGYDPSLNATSLKCTPGPGKWWYATNFSCNGCFDDLMVFEDTSDTYRCRIYASPTASPTTLVPTTSPTMSPSVSPTSSSPTTSPTTSPTLSLFVSPHSDCWKTYVIDEATKFTTIGNSSGVFSRESVVFHGFPQSGACSNVRNVLGGGHPWNVKYSLKVASKPNNTTVRLCTGDASGKTTITAEGAGLYEFTFVADDGLGSPIEHSWRVLVTDRSIVQPQLRVTVNDNSRVDLNSRFASHNRTQWAINATYRIAPVVLISATTSEGDIVDVQNVQYVLDNSPPGFFIDGSTGALLGEPSQVVTTMTSTLYATYEGTLRAKVREFHFAFLAADTADDSAGPNGRGCSGHGTKVDTIEFDNIFTCRCDAGYTSHLNCDLSLELLTPLLGVTSLVAVILVLWRLQVYRLKHCPVDMNAIQLQLMKDLGLGTTVNMKNTEIGVTVTVSKVDFRSPELEGFALESFQNALLRTVADRLKISSLGAWVHPGPSPSRAFVLVFGKPAENVELFERKVRVTLDSQLKAEKCSLNGMKLTSAVIAVPRQTPREISRQSLLRLDAIGHGNFSDVFKGVLSEGRDGSILKVVVAVKVCHTKSTELAREDLLKEAALMVFFHHRNVLSLIGVITKPRDMPPLLVLQYCENKSLLHFLTNAQGTISIQTKLTFCAEIARGLEYISSRRVIHRDVAARNIMLDMLLVCKVADFGMSTSLHDSKEYTRIGGDADALNESKQLAVRWAAPEIIKEGKFSTQSDVWAFGVLVWEVFSNGQTPYEGLTLIEVIVNIRNRVVLPKPQHEEYPIEFYTNLMATCFKYDAGARPTFGVLYDIAVHLGASEDEDAIEEHDLTQSQRELSGNGETSGSHCVDDITSLTSRGPSVHHLSTTFIKKAIKAVRKQASKFKDLKCVADATIYHMVKAYGEPQGLQHTCPRDGGPGAAYVDTLRGEDNVGRACALLSYSWAYKVQDVVDALVEWTRKGKRDPKHTYIWICSLCLNQHRIVTALTPLQLSKVFGDRVEAIGRILPMMEDWQNPGYVKRAWCLFELYTALRMKSIQVEIILTPSQRKFCADAIKNNGFRVIDQALDQVKSENATATEKADFEAIKSLIEGYQGGYTALNEAVKVRLRSWFHKITGIRFARTSAANMNLPPSPMLSNTSDTNHISFTPGKPNLSHEISASPTTTTHPRQLRSRSFAHQYSDDIEVVEPDVQHQLRLRSGSGSGSGPIDMRNLSCNSLRSLSGFSSDGDLTSITYTYKNVAVSDTIVINGRTYCDPAVLSSKC